MNRTLAALAVIVAVGFSLSRAVAGPAPEATEVPEAPAPSAPVTPDEADERVMRGADLTLPQLFRAGGAFSYVMIALSMAVAAAAVYCAIECRSSRVAPEAERARVAELLAAGDRAGAVAALEGAPSLYARGVRRALADCDGSPVVARGFLRASGEHDAAVLRGRLAMLPRIAAVAALVGVIGTLVGMHQAFGVAAMEVYRPLFAYAAVFKGLVLSVFGVGLAAVALAVYYILAGRLERALAEAAYAFEEVGLYLRRSTPAESGAVASAPALASASAAVGAP